MTNNLEKDEQGFYRKHEDSSSELAKTPGLIPTREPGIRILEPGSLAGQSKSELQEQQTEPPGYHTLKSDINLLKKELNRAFEQIEILSKRIDKISNQVRQAENDAFASDGHACPSEKL